MCFVDLRPVPDTAVPLSPEGFAVLIGVLVAASHLDARALAEAVDDVDVKTKVGPNRCAAIQVCSFWVCTTLGAHRPMLLRSHTFLLQVTVVGRFDTWQTSHGPFSGKVRGAERP